MVFVRLINGWRTWYLICERDGTSIKTYMKNIFFLSVLLVVCGYCSNAQKVHLGLKAGLNISNLNEEANTVNFSSKPGFHGGGLAHIHLTDKFAIQPEVVFSTQGAKRDNANPEQKLNLGYINVPVLVQYMFSNGFRLETGPQFGFLMSAKSEIGDVEFNVKDDYKTFDFSWTAGLGYISPSGFGADARYNLGLTNIRENSTNDLNNRVFQVGIFYQFNSKRK